MIQEIAAQNESTPSRPAVDPGFHRLYRQLCESMARQLPLDRLLPETARLLETCLPQSRAVIHVLRDGCFFAYTSSGTLDRLLASLQQTSAEPGPRQAPWWPHRDRVTLLATAPSWRPWAAEAARAGWRSWWCTSLVTAAGEVVGSASLLSAMADPDLSGCMAELSDVASLGAAIVEQANVLSELTWHVWHDPLTSLYNRAWFERHVDTSLSSLPPGLSAMFLFSMDYSRINRVLGYRIGDRLLVEAGGRLTRSLRTMDATARVGDHELACVVQALPNHDEAVGLARRLRDVLSAPFEVEGHTLSVNPVASICYLAEHGTDAATLLTRARVAMAHVDSGGGIAVFSEGMEDGGVDRLEIEQRLHHALPAGQFFLQYQPQVRLADLHLEGVEALLRWRQPDLGVVSPAVFIPVAEETGLILEIGAWVLEEACRQGVLWLHDGRRIQVGVNISAAQFASLDFAASVEVCLERTGLPPALLELEVTESLVLTDFAVATRHLRRLRERGARVALDDFGTGHSSLAYLRELPVDRVKIDRAFLRDIDSPTQRGLLTHIIGMAHDLGLEVIAEGAETAEQVAALRELQCDEVQGFALGRPMLPADLIEWSSAPAPAIGPQPRVGVARNQPDAPIGAARGIVS
ncbi:MAG: bifunctional diguanylate cyclase/phosphodiesterase [Bryobacteraceae bacterium]